jgi:hypothetical protein
MSVDAAWYNLKNSKVYFEIPSKWSAHKNILGLPLVLTSPLKKKSRIIVSVTPTNIKGENNLFFDEKNYSSYISGRQKWVKEKKGTIKSIYKYKKLDWNNIKNIHRAGYTYTLSKNEFEEFSYYLKCNTQLFHIKSLRRINEFPHDKSTLDKMLKSFRCK